MEDAASLDVLTQRDQVAASLCQRGDEVSYLPCTLDLLQIQHALNQNRPELVFNLTESLGGTDRLMAAATMLLDALQIPYTGCKTLSILRSGDKLSAKRELVKAGIATPRWFEPQSRYWQGKRSPVQPMPKRCIVKAIYEHASFGIDNESVVELIDEDLLVKMVTEKAIQDGTEYLIEEFIDGREFNLSLLEIDRKPRVLSPAEIDMRGLPDGFPRIVSAAAKWEEGSVQYIQTPRRFDFSDDDHVLIGKLKSTAIDCWELFELSGYARVDFRVTAEGEVYVLEINANPCLSKDAGFVAAAEQSGIGYDRLIQWIVGAAKKPC